MKKCKICKQIKPISDFYLYRKNNKPYPSCKQCYKQKYYVEKRKKRMSEQKCCHCGKIKEDLNFVLCNTCKNNKKKYCNSLKGRIRSRTNQQQRLKYDIQYKLARNLRNRLKDAIKNNYKSGSAVQDLGCSIQELKTWLENKFQPGMSWNNYGKWHIDHIIPLSSFDLTNREELLKACHYTNLQPLWEIDNLRKGNKLNEVTSTSSKNDEILD